MFHWNSYYNRCYFANLSYFKKGESIYNKQRHNICLIVKPYVIRPKWQCFNCSKVKPSPRNWHYWTNLKRKCSQPAILVAHPSVCLTIGIITLPHNSCVETQITLGFLHKNNPYGVFIMFISIKHGIQEL